MMKVNAICCNRGDEDGMGDLRNNAQKLGFKKMQISEMTKR